MSRRRYDHSKYINLFQKVDQSTGEIVAESKWGGSPFGDGWVMMYKEVINEMIHSISMPPTALRVFLKLASMQSYDMHIVCSRTYLMKDLGITRKTLWKSLKWLKEENIIMEDEYLGRSSFIINPAVSNCGTQNIGEKERKFRSAAAAGGVSLRW